jgi:hypothetical protein
MPLPLRDFVQQVLIENERAGKIHRAVLRAWKATVEKYPERARWRRKSTFRGLFWEEAVRELATLTETDPDFKLAGHRDTASFILEQSVLFRFKHANVALATANYPTPEAMDFDRHDVDLYGYQGMQRAELCYVLNEFETDIVWVGIAASADGNHLWKIELADDGVVPAQTELPSDAEEEEESDPAKLARIKKAQPERKDAKRKSDGET